MLFANHYWKKWLRKHGCKLANGLEAIHKNSSVIIESPVTLGHMNIRATNLVIGAHTFIRSTAKLDLVSSIGRFCGFSSNAYIGHEKQSHPMNWVSTHPFQFSVENAPFPYHPVTKPVIIEHDVWMGTNVTILEGVHIGTGCIIASRAVVTKDVPPYAVVAGNPAKIVKYRLPEEIYKQLLASQWWEYPLEILNTLPLNDPQQFLMEIASIPLIKAEYTKIKLTRQRCEEI